MTSPGGIGVGTVGASSLSHGLCRLHPSGHPALPDCPGHLSSGIGDIWAALTFRGSQHLGSVSDHTTTCVVVCFRNVTGWGEGAGEGGKSPPEGSVWRV